MVAESTGCTIFNYREKFAVKVAREITQFPDTTQTGVGKNFAICVDYLPDVFCLHSFDTLSA